MRRDRESKRERESSVAGSADKKEKKKRDRCSVGGSADTAL
jgi:hypothetical protein